MASLTLRLAKGSPLANAEVDANFTSLDSSKLEKSGGSLSGPINEAPPSTIASSSTINLDNVTSNYISVTGSATISTITLSAGAQRHVVFSDTPTLHAGASLILPNGTGDLVAQSGDVAVFRGEGNGVVRCTHYTRASGLPLVNPAVSKTDVGLSQVDNTSDVNKPISQAQQAALDLKAPKSQPSFTGGITVTGTSSFSDVVTVSGGGITVLAGGVTVSGASSFSGGVTLPNGGITATAGVVSAGGLTAGGNGVVSSGGVKVSAGSVSVDSGNLSVAGSTTTNGITSNAASTFVNSITVQSGGIEVDHGDVRLATGNLIVAGNANLTGVTASAASVFSAGLTVQQGMTLASGNMAVQNGNLSVSGSATVAGLTSSSAATITGGITIPSGDISVTAGNLNLGTGKASAGTVVSNVQQVKARVGIKSSVNANSSTVTLDLSTANVFKLTISANTVVQFTNPQPGSNEQRFRVITSNAVAGCSLGWPPSITKFAGGTIPSRNTALNAVGEWEFYTEDGGSTYVGRLIQDDIR